MHKVIENAWGYFRPVIMFLKNELHRENLYLNKGKGKCYVTINVTYTLNNKHTNCVGPSFVWLLLSVYVTLIVT